jgi:hypothetical protein
MNVATSPRPLTYLYVVQREKFTFTCLIVLCSDFPSYGDKLLSQISCLQSIADFEKLT